MVTTVNELQAQVELQQQYITRAEKTGVPEGLLVALQEELAILQAKLNEAQGTEEPSDLNGEAAQYQIRRALLQKAEATAKLNSKLSQREAESEFKRSINPQYDWEIDPLKEDDLKLINKYRAELQQANDVLVKLQGVVTHRIGQDADEAVDALFSPSLMPLKSASSAYKALCSSDAGEGFTDCEVSTFAPEDEMLVGVIRYLRHASATRAYSLLRPIFELASEQAQRNHIASRRYLEESKATEMDKLWNQVNRRIKLLARKVGVQVNGDRMPDLDDLRAAVEARPDYQIDTITWSVEEWKRQAGPDWDESIIEVINFLVDCNVIKLSERIRTSQGDVAQMERNLAEMRKPLSSKRFEEHSDPEIAAAAQSGGAVWAAFREQYRVRINTIKNERVRRSTARR